MAQVSLLIGAGFSIPLGYPSAAGLTEKFLNLKPERFSIQSDGTIYMLPPGQEDNPGFYGNFIHKHFFCESIHYYNERFQGFNYEAFFDFLYQNRNNHLRDSDFEAFIVKFLERDKERGMDAPNLISTAIRSLDQAVVHFLVDRNGHQYYDDLKISINSISEHHNILNCIQKLGENNIVQIHSLNHDLLFERYRNSEYLKGELADGFEIENSPYFYQRERDGKYIRISYFTNNYNQRFNLYKLHSSVDYYPFYTPDEQGIIACCI